MCVVCSHVYRLDGPPMQEHEKIKKIVISFVAKLITKIKGPPDLFRFFSILKNKC